MEESPDVRLSEQGNNYSEHRDGAVVLLHNESPRASNEARSSPLPNATTAQNCSRVIDGKL
jgi:hypothetical protein